MERLFKTFHAFKAERPYKYTKAFTEEEWNKHLYGIWRGMNKTFPAMRPYIITTKDNLSFEVWGADYLDAKLTAVKTHNISIEDIKSVL